MGSTIPLQKYVVSRDKETDLVDVFAALKGTDGTGELTLGLTTLEAVFLKIAKEAELAEGKGKTTLIEVESMLLKGGNSEVSVAIGSDKQIVKMVAADGSQEQFVVEVEWGQDEDGNFDAVGKTVRKPTAEELAEGAPAP